MDLEPRPAKKWKKAAKTKPTPEALMLADATAPKALLPTRSHSEVPAPPAPRLPMPLTLTGKAWHPTAKIMEAEEAVIAAKLPAPISSIRKGPVLATRQDHSALTTNLTFKDDKRKVAGATPEAHISLPGPALPYELTSLNAAGIAKVLASVGTWGTPEKPKSSWFLSSLVAMCVAATVLGGVFYAMPTLAGPTRAAAPQSTAVPVPVAPTPEPELPSDPLSKAIEVTGVRFVTGIPDRRPEIHYLVVNHSNVALTGIVVHVTLRSGSDPAPVAQFSFRTPRMNAFESKEMASTIERMGDAVPDWRRLKADIHIVQ